MKSIGKNIIWVFVLFSSYLYGQNENSLVGSYVLKEEIGIHVVPGLSSGDVHSTSYISSVDTTITNTLILDSLGVISFISDTTFSPIYLRIGRPIIKMMGTWSVIEDTLVVHYSSVDTTYNNHVPVKEIITTTIDGVEYKILPDKEPIPTPLRKPIQKKFKIMTWDKGVYSIIPCDEKRERITYRKQ
jgi:hypothetical protein